MDSTTTIEDRIERQQTEEMQDHIVSDEPLVVEVDNKDSQSTHTVTPHALHCSCEDHIYRRVICKHMIQCANSNHDDVSTAMLRSFVDRMKEIQVEESKLESELEAMRDERDAIREVRKNLGGEVVDDEESSEIDDTGSDTEINVDEEFETLFETEDEDNLTETDQFRSMVEDLTDGQ